jgi:Pyruvate/2-oxoacid:ferredoxin oxidoreductase delta subunit
MIQYIIVLMIVAWAAWIALRNLIGFFKPAEDNSSCAGCKGCALKTIDPAISAGKTLSINKS